MIRLEHLTKRFAGGRVAVDDLTLEVGEGQLCVLVGPSGSGKTTTMKMVNRLVEPTSGRILLDGEDVTTADPVRLRRRIGYVIQQIGLFPHQTVATNVGTVPRLLGWDRRRTTERVDELLELVGLDAADFRNRYPHQLSGGQRQRVGVARALGADPPVLLMDEPFGAIDPITRERLQNEFLRLQAELRKTVVFVTHDVGEAVKLGDTIAVLAQGGRLAQHDVPAAILGRPASDFVAEFVGADRGLKRLEVTPVGVAELAQPALVGAGAPLGDARAAMERTGDDYAVVVDDDRMLRGYVSRERVDGDGVVEDRALPVDAKVGCGASLKDALSRLLLSDAAWVAVVDGNRFLGVVTPQSLHVASRRGVERAGQPHDPPPPTAPQDGAGASTAPPSAT
ncbi:MAG TPA: betaine/proline/choline family ABC transporter ATP-binding protein [Acidimicrobiales bacterium]|nr:betaine/proline/choline family ABC transporter ATP-binding protein [Acidimicrobiales bacterium]